MNIREEEASKNEALLQDEIPDEYSHMTVTSSSIVPSIGDEEDKERFIQEITDIIRRK